MDKFLQHIASFLFNKYPEGLSDLIVVFPNRRAGLFFQKYLSQLVDKPIFSPKVLTISELITGFSELKIMDNNSLIILLWETYTEITGKEESLDDFFYWGEMLFSDFNDIDKYLVNAEMLFKNIVSLKEIDSGFDFLTEEQISFLSSFWSNILQVKSSGEKSQFINNWRFLYHVYFSFVGKLKDKGLAYEGMIYREMVSSLPDAGKTWEGKNIAIVGFNALNNCEKKLFDFLKVNCNADFFWDYDQYYLSGDQHEASLFMNTNIKRYPSPTGFEFNSFNFETLRNIDMVSVPGFSGQAVYASQWLNENKNLITDSFDNTAIVLCDESLLQPLLSSLPESVGDLNITMGFPLKNSSVFSLVKGLIDIDKNGRTNESGVTRFYYRNVIALLNNPLIKPAIADFSDKLSEKIQKENKIYITKDDMADNSLLQLIFSLPVDSVSVKEYFHLIITQLFTFVSEDDPFTKESLYQLYLLISQLHNTLFDNDKKRETIISKKLFYQLLLRSAEKMNIPFEGEPLSGMQVMGFLETRCLDFDNLILLSFNDDKLPGNPHQHSFIPYSLRKGFDLPVIEHRNAMYAYYFYRLVQRAKKVTLVYDSRTDGLTKGEVSRYATQLKYEAAHLTLTAKQGVFNFDSYEVLPITIEKNRLLLDKLEKIFTNKIVSPTFLSTYLDCKLSFYFRYVEGIRESEDLFEEIDHLIFGRIAHLAMEGLYKPYIGRILTQDSIKSIIADKKLISYHTTEALKKEFFKGGNFDLNGKNMLIFDIIEKYIFRILKYDLQIAPIDLLSLEREYSSDLTINIDTRTISVRIGGTIDRLDNVQDQIRVVDYKTGKSESAVKTIDSLFKASGDRNKAAFQTMIYAHCVNEQLHPAEAIVPAVYGARAVFTSDFNPRFQIGGKNMIYQQYAAEFIGLLSSLIEEILNPEIPFSQVADNRKCSYCPYNSICNRGV
jgi:CRISPR/Cas system-associated exonuclease Cas4 (RecB family)